MSIIWLVNSFTYFQAVFHLYVKTPSWLQSLIRSPQLPPFLMASILSPAFVNFYVFFQSLWGSSLWSVLFSAFILSYNMVCSTMFCLYLLSVLNGRVNILFLRRYGFLSAFVQYTNGIAKKLSSLSLTTFFLWRTHLYRGQYRYFCEFRGDWPGSGIFYTKLAFRSVACFK